jgi:hypothetical protein
MEDSSVCARARPLLLSLLPICEVGLRAPAFVAGDLCLCRACPLTPEQFAVKNSSK